MKTIEAKSFGIFPNDEISKKLEALFESLESQDEETTVIFEKGTYHIDAERSKKRRLVVTNTVGDGEFSKDEVPHLVSTALYLSRVSNVTLDAGGSVFVVDGKATNVALEECENVTLKNLEIRHSHPDMHELRVLRKGLFSVDFEVDRDSRCELKEKKLRFVGKGFQSRFSKKAFASGPVALLIREKEPERVFRVLCPLFSATSVSSPEKNVLRVRFPNTSRFKLGDRYYIYDVRRQFVGIFINRCKNVTLDSVKQRFNYSLALVAQDSENLKIENVCFAPEEGSARKIASCADFIQLCSCRGKITVKNSLFEGAGDDCLNVHGIHFQITAAEKNEATVRFMHPQTHGFNPFKALDEIAYIDPDTLLEKGRAVVESSELKNEYEIRLRLSGDAPKAGLAVENVSACPELVFENNELGKIVTRGLLITTRGKVLVKNNRFKNTGMSAILLSDDAKSWFESGMCRRVEIEKNVFEFCGGIPILIKPENKTYKGAVHKNIKISENRFISFKKLCVKASSTDNITIEKNDFSGRLFKGKNCLNVEIDRKGQKT